MRPSSRAWSLLFVAALIAAMVPAAVPHPVQAASSGTLIYTSPSYDRTDEVVFTPGEIEPGEPFHIHVVSDEKLYPPQPSELCEEQVYENALYPLTEWFTAKVELGQSIYPPNQVQAQLRGDTGTKRVLQQSICSPQYLHINTITEFDVSAASSAAMTPGCYQTSGYNPQLITRSPNSALHQAVSGSIAVLSVGGATCDQTEELTLVGHYSYSGALKGPVILATGTDSVAVEGSAAALAQVVETCVTSTWTAHAKFGQQSSLRFLWNGEVAPFTYSPLTFALDDTYSAKPKPGSIQILVTHGEIVTLTRCDSGAGRAYPALPWGNSSLSVLFQTAFLNISHSITVSATLTDGRVISVAVPSSSSGKKGQISWDEEASTTFEVVVP